MERWLARLDRRHHIFAARRRREEYERREREVAQRQILLRYLLEVLMNPQALDPP